MVGSDSEDSRLPKIVAVPFEEFQGKGLCDQTFLFLRLTTSLSTPAKMGTGAPRQVRPPAAMDAIASGSPQLGLEGR